MFNFSFRRNSINAAALDQKWHAALKPMAYLSVLPFFSHSAKELALAEKEFIETDADYPRLKPVELAVRKVEARVGQLQVLAEKIRAEENNAYIKRAYQQRIKEIIIINRLLLAAQFKDEEVFAELTSELYGQPDLQALAAVCGQMLRVLTKDNQIAGGPPNSRELVELLEKGTQLADPSDLLLSPELFGQAQDYFNKRFQNIMAEVDSNEEVDARRISEIMAEVLTKLEIEEWEPVVAAGRSGLIHIDHRQRMIIIPEHRRVRRKRLRELVAHEVITHIWRRHNGERSKLLLLGIGLDHYLPGEEAVAILRQQLLKKNERIPLGAAVHYFSIALALGVIDGRPRNFRQVYEMMKKYYAIRASQKTKANQNAEDKAWRATIRLFRGVSGQQPGICYTKDLVYLNGYHRLVAALREDLSKQELFDKGKLDPANEEHVSLIRALEL